MHRTDAAGNVDGLHVPGSLTPPLQEATVIGSDWLNAVQEEICNVVEAHTPLVKADNTQLLAALNAMYGRLAAYVWGGHDADANGSQNYNGSISRTGTGVYVVTLTEPVAADNTVPVVVTVNDSAPRVPTYAWGVDGTSITVRVFNLSGTPTDAFVSVVVPRGV
ncbi:hypothetical protein [Archangium lansingense]|uniref:Uncharacterized protein n=1 Tax=Archangium lansingense TaxID=2995310 RepID=A0ABT4A706_9BACT|nr:hypothetical protein [Archangium lansinium]MCY1077412.1 hypothetical protein [Archangium lansinium]